MSNFSKVGIFMKTFGQEVKDKPSFSTDKINKLRIDLIGAKWGFFFNVLTKCFHENSNLTKIWHIAPVSFIYLMYIYNNLLITN